MICSYLFVDLGNLFKVVVHHSLIGGMVVLGHWDEVRMVCALAYTITHSTRPIVGHDIRLLSSHDFTKLLYCIIFQP